MSVLVSVLVEVAGDGFTMVVLLSFFSAGGFVTVVSFCSQAARSAAPMKRQMYLFMQGFDGRSRYFLRRRRRRGRFCRGGGCARHFFGRSGRAGRRSDRFSFLLASREHCGTTQNADVS